MACSQWNWTPLNNLNEENRYLLKRKSNNEMRNSISHVKSQDTYQRIVDRGTIGHQNDSKTQLMIMDVCRSVLPRIEEHMTPPEQ